MLISLVEMMAIIAQEDGRDKEEDRLIMEEEEVHLHCNTGAPSPTYS